MGVSSRQTPIPFLGQNWSATNESDNHSKAIFRLTVIWVTDKVSTDILYWTFALFLALNILNCFFKHYEIDESHMFFKKISFIYVLY